MFLSFNASIWLPNSVSEWEVSLEFNLLIIYSAISPSGSPHCITFFLFEFISFKAFFSLASCLLEQCCLLRWLWLEMCDNPPFSSCHLCWLFWPSLFPPLNLTKIGVYEEKCVILSYTVWLLQNHSNGMVGVEGISGNFLVQCSFSSTVIQSLLLRIVSRQFWISPGMESPQLPGPPVPELSRPYDEKVVLDVQFVFQFVPILPLALSRAPLKPWLCPLHTLPPGMSVRGSPSLFSYERCSSCFIIFMVALQYVPIPSGNGEHKTGLSPSEWFAEQRERVTSLSALLLMQPRTRSAFPATRTHCWLVFHLVSLLLLVCYVFCHSFPSVLVREIGYCQQYLQPCRHGGSHCWVLDSSVLVFLQESTKVQNPSQSRLERINILLWFKTRMFPCK